MSILHQNRVLKLNAKWQPIGVTTPEKAFIAMSRKDNKSGKRQYSSLHIELPLLPNGNIDFESACTILPVKWEDWIGLPVRANDEFIGTASKKIRVPTVIIANNYDRVPLKYPRYSKNAVWNRDKGVCAITQEKLTRSTGNIDHWTSRHNGGDTSFENCLVLSKKLNSLKGNLNMEEFCKKYGYKLPRKPERPKIKELIIPNIYGIKDWELFAE